jgi:NAD(P)H-hydrate repair Nnr-like enzyme with NAD(P)H-hydrate dehydratase domain
MMLAAYGGSLVMRTASRAAFQQQGRAMLAGDIIPHLQPAFQQWWPDPRTP